MSNNADYHSDVRSRSSPIEFSIFDRGNTDRFLGRARLLPRTNSQADGAVTLPLEGREDFESVSGSLQVNVYFVEKRPNPRFEDFITLDNERSILVTNVFIP
jgi:hypothetical protein